MINILLLNILQNHPTVFSLVFFSHLHFFGSCFLTGFFCRFLFASSGPILLTSTFFIWEGMGSWGRNAVILILSSSKVFPYIKKSK